MRCVCVQLHLVLHEPSPAAAGDIGHQLLVEDVVGGGLWEAL